MQRLNYVLLQYFLQYLLQYYFFHYFVTVFVILLLLVIHFVILYVFVINFVQDELVWSLLSVGTHKCKGKEYVEALNPIKAFLCYFLRNFDFSQNDSPSKTMKDVFYFI